MKRLIPRSLSRYKLTAALILAALFQSNLTAWAAAPFIWQLKYDTGAGEANLFLCDSGVKIHYFYHQVLLCTAPKWQLCYFSTKLKNYYELPLNSKMLEQEANLAGYDFRKAPASGAENWCGAKTTKATITGKDFRLNSFSTMIANDSLKARSINLYETDALPLNKDTLRISQAFFAERYGVHSGKFPLGLKIVQPDSKEVWIFKLRSIRQIAFDPKIYERPKNLSRAKTMGAVYLDDGQQSALRDLAEDMDLGTALGNKKK